MDTYIIVYKDELNHYGIKGMKWGVRKPERHRNGKMSTGKKIAIGISVAVAVAGVSYVAVKTHQTSVYNRLARKAVKRAMAQGSRAGKRMNNLNLTRGPAGKIRTNQNRLAASKNSYFRQTKAGASVHRKLFYDRKAAETAPSSNYFTNPNLDKKRQYEIHSQKAQDEWMKIYDNNGRIVPKQFVKTPINKLRKKK